MDERKDSMSIRGPNEGKESVMIILADEFQQPSRLDRLSQHVTAWLSKQGLEGHGLVKHDSSAELTALPI